MFKCKSIICSILVSLLIPIALTVNASPLTNDELKQLSVKYKNSVKHIKHNRYRITTIEMGYINKKGFVLSCDQRTSHRPTKINGSQAPCPTDFYLDDGSFSLYKKTITYVEGSGFCGNVFNKDDKDIVLGKVKVNNEYIDIHRYKTCRDI